jgi:NADH dehydrogenase/NADH:ubiquinone oxidoreductase subunit G
MSTETVNITINGKALTPAKGTMLLQAARAAGIDIPTLCHHDELAGFGACRLCIVEIDQGGWKKIVASCLFPVAEGLVVETESERVVKNRRSILELLRARWSGIDPELLKRYQVPEGRLAEEDTFCVMCGLCARHCTERKKANVLGFVGRGTGRQVALHPDAAQRHCPDCGKDSESKTMECLAICPTGVVVNDFAQAPPHLRPTGAIVYPVRARDDENAVATNKLAGG